MEKKKSAAERKKTARENAAVAKQKLRDRVVAAAAAVAEAQAEVAVTRKRQDLLIRMSEKREIAVAKFVESWSKKEMAKINKALKPKLHKRRK